MAPTQASGAQGRQAREPEKVAWRVRREAGWALGASAPMQKHLRAALGGLDKSTVSRMVSGEKPSAVSRFYDLVRSLVVEGRTDAGHLIGGAMLVAEDAALTLPSGEIRRRLADSLAQESLDEGRENVAQHELAVALGEDGPGLRAALEAYDEAVRHEAASHVDALVYARALMRVRGWR